MRHFGFLGRAERERLFVRAPEAFSIDDEPERLGAWLGATLYCPATRPRLAEDISKRAIQGVMDVASFQRWGWR